MLKNVDAETLIQDAREMLTEGERLLELGDWRNAAEKGWLAVCNATAALALDVTGVHNQTSADINAGLRKLALERGGEWVELRRRHSDVAHHLYSQAFYNGIYDDDIPDLVRGAADYIALAEELAG